MEEPTRPPFRAAPRTDPQVDIGGGPGSIPFRFAIATTCLALGALLAMFGPAMQERCVIEGRIGSSVARQGPIVYGLDSSRYVVQPEVDAALAWEDIRELEASLTRQDGYRLVAPGFLVATISWAALGLVPVLLILRRWPRVAIGATAITVALATFAVLAPVAVAADAGTPTAGIDLGVGSGDPGPDWDWCETTGFQWFDWPWSP